MVDSDSVKAVLRTQRIELPSWAFGNSGTRFKVFAQKGVPRSPFEKIEDASRVHAHTGVAPSVALHIPWDAVDDYGKLAQAAAEVGIQLGTVNANVFQDDDYMLGSVTNPDAAIRRKALDHLLACVDVMDETGSRDLKLWFSDGTNYPGQDNIRARQDRLAEALSAVYERLSADQRLILEYKLFEPAFYTMDVPDWGTSYAHCLKLGDRALVCVDTGHHAPGTNIEFIVAFLLREGKLGAFDFNSRFYADDDLMVGSADPFQLFRILFEVASAGGLEASAGIAFMLDQCHNIEPKIPGQIRSVMNVQEATAKALLVDLDELASAQAAGDVLGANAVLMDAYNTDVRPLLAELRQELGLEPDPMAAYRRSGYAEKIIAERIGGNQAGWGALTVSELSSSATSSSRRSNRLGADPRNTNYAGGNTSAKAVGDRPGDVAAGRAACGSRDPAVTWARLTKAVWRFFVSTGCVPWLTSTRVSTARTRWLRPSTSACTARAEPRLPSTPPCMASSRRSRRPPASRLGHRARDGRRRRAADRRVLRRPGGVGPVATTRLPARSRHRRDQGGQPAGDRLRARRARHHRLG